MPKIFLSYRRADSQAIVGRMADRLSREFGSDDLFRDLESIHPGADFPSTIQNALDQSQLLLVAIGSQWLHAANPDGTRRIDDPHDFVRREVEIALRAGKAVIPVLIDGAGMPAAAALPKSIRALASRNALNLRSGADFDNDMARLIAAIEATTTALREHSEQAASATPLVVAAVAAAAGGGLLWLMVAHATTLVRLGLVGNVWYVLLLALGLAAAIIVFALFKSYAKYTRKTSSTTVKLGVPAVVMLVVVVLGHWMVPPPRPRFDVTVFVHGEAGRQVQVLRGSGKLSLDLGVDRRQESIGDKGEARFVGIPSDLRDQRVGVGLESDQYELLDPRPEIKLDAEVHYIPVRPKSTRLVGMVMDARSKPLAGARVSMAGRAALTDADGRFELTLPVILPESDRTVTVTAEGHEPWRTQGVPGGNAMQVRLEAASTVR